MSVRSFFDTNDLIYTDGAEAPEKCERAGCALLFSEDLQRGRRIAGLQIIDPFSR